MFYDFVKYYSKHCNAHYRYNLKDSKGQRISNLEGIGLQTLHVSKLIYEENSALLKGSNLQKVCRKGLEKLKIMG